jgi:hypothetical protein
MVAVTLCRSMSVFAHVEQCDARDEGKGRVPARNRSRTCCVAAPHLASLATTHATDPAPLCWYYPARRRVPCAQVDLFLRIGHSRVVRVDLREIGLLAILSQQRPHAMMKLALNHHRHGCQPPRPERMRQGTMSDTEGRTQLRGSHHTWRGALGRETR